MITVRIIKKEKNMRKFYQNKLWRDKLVKIREDKGAIVHLIPLSDGDYSDELNMKLIEEANELYEADSHEKITDEIVDILEAIDCLLKVHDISHEEIMKLKEKKKAEQGSYTDRRLVDYVEYPAGSAEEKYCLENEERYPELCEEDDGSSINNCCK